MVSGASNRASTATVFVTLVEVLCEHRTRLLLSAGAMPFELFEDILTQDEAKAKPHLLSRPNAVVDDNLGFSKDRAVSRLTEMQSLEYLLHHAQRHLPGNVLALQEALAKSNAQQWKESTKKSSAA
ncbi:hypothetical protein FOA52_007449 [Chlamydomonas sp. UWO 241]|nr:hypothetical protein FOA52_007449 [Chlamydomonas sp. UWO 241]